MNAFRRKILRLWNWLQPYWHDPVWSKVIAGIITSVGAGVIAFIWLGAQAILHQAPLVDAIRGFIHFLGLSSVVNNGVIALFLLLAFFLLFLNTGIFRKGLRNKRASAPPAPAEPIIAEYGLLPGDRNLHEAFQILKGNPFVATQIDHSYGPVEAFDVNFDADQVDCSLKVKEQLAMNVLYLYLPADTTFVFYLRVHVTNGADSWPIQKWIALRLNVVKVSEGINQPEKAYPVRWEKDQGDWLRTKLHLPTLVEEIFGSEGLKFHKLLGFRIRGKGKIARIVLS